MGTRALVGITCGSGEGILAIHVSYDGGKELASLLNDYYRSREMAANLISLGDLSVVGKTIDLCELTPAEVHQDAVYCPTFEDFEAMKYANEYHVHVYDDYGWNHLVTEIDDLGFEN